MFWSVPLHFLIGSILLQSVPSHEFIHSRMSFSLVKYDGTWFQLRRYEILRGFLVQEMRRMLVFVQVWCARDRLHKIMLDTVIYDDLLPSPISWLTLWEGADVEWWVTCSSLVVYHQENMRSTRAGPGLPRKTAYHNLFKEESPSITRNLSKRREARSISIVQMESRDQTSTEWICCSIEEA